MLRVVVVVAAALLAAACAGRAPNPVSVVQAQDQTTDCAGIQAEITANNARVAALAEEQGWKTTQNVAAGVVGLVIWPVWFGMDFQGAATKEAEALRARQQYLATLAQQRCQPPAPAPRRR